MSNFVLRRRFTSSLACLLTKWNKYFCFLRVSMYDCYSFLTGNLIFGTIWVAAAKSGI